MSSQNVEEKPVIPYDKLLTKYEEKATLCHCLLASSSSPHKLSQGRLQKWKMTLSTSKRLSAC